ncbi:alpha-galactosidase D [Terriglobus saanensis]|uniref:alpha-galactosidase D n=1 Tax=Terriglobus saanensis TaxID=870903 RepID=UPI0002E3E25F|nr:TIM-barrel domain-containing protein [Terriglobus saanensis]
MNGAGQKPYLGWSSFSQQTLDGGFLTQASMETQSDALRNSGLQQHGFQYINLDSGWQGSFDGNGRPIPNSTTFPDIKAMVDHIHANGQKAGIYWIPGIEQPAVDGNYPILGTPYHTQDIVVKPLTAGNAFGGASPNPYHDKIDFSKPGSHEYIDSVVALFASWGFDFIKLDAVTPGSYSDDLSIDNREDVAAWSNAIAKTGKPIWLTISWQLSKDYLNTWQQYANARRIDDDVECEGRCATLTNWPRIVLRQYDLVGWEKDAGPSVGWNDLDTLDVGDGALDGLSDEEKQSAITIWSMANAPLYLGGDLTKLDAFAKNAFSNDELLAVDQSGHPATQITGGMQPVWLSDAGTGNRYVALFNLNDIPSRVTVRWSDLGFTNVTSMKDLWNRIDLGPSTGSFSTVVLPHGSRLLKVRPQGVVHAAEGQSYEAEAAVLTGNATVYACQACSGGSKVGYIGASATSNAVTFTNVRVDKAGTYRMQVDAMTQGPRALIFSANNGPSTTLNMGGGSFNLPQSTTVSVTLQQGVNSITFYNAGTYAVDLDRIVVSGTGNAVAPESNTYEAEAAILGGTATISGCSFCSGGASIGSFGAGDANTVTFADVTVPHPGIYQLGIEYLTSGPRSFQIAINGNPPIELDLNGSSFESPANTAMPVQLQGGQNRIVFGSSGFAPGLDSITVGPVVTNSNLIGAITGTSGLRDLRFWRMKVSNQGTAPAKDARLNSFTVMPASGDTTCKVLVPLPVPLPLGNISPGGVTTLEIPLAFSPACREDSIFTVHSVFSANNGADVGVLESNSQAK